MHLDYFNNNPNAFKGGNHGYDNRYHDMQALFIAQGPNFQSTGDQVDTFANIHIYNLMSHILGVNPAANNGSFAVVQHLLNQ